MLSELVHISSRRDVLAMLLRFFCCLFSLNRLGILRRVG